MGPHTSIGTWLSLGSQFSEDPYRVGVPVCFERSDDIYKIVAVAGDHISNRNRILYGFRVRNEGGVTCCEQIAYSGETETRQ